MATVTLTDLPLTEPTNNENFTAAILTLITSSGGALETDIVVNVTASGGTASECCVNKCAIWFVFMFHCSYDPQLP